MADFDPKALRSAFGQFGTGVTIITAVKPSGAQIGVTANSMTSVSLDPPMLLWCLATRSSSVDAFELGRRFNVHILERDQEELAMSYARPSSQDASPETGAPDDEPLRLDGVLARMDCSVEAIHQGGDHLIIVGRVDGFAQFGGEPLMFHAGKFGTFASEDVAPPYLPLMADGWV
ncbi:flavin reductase family protein [Henriciella litoralis]|uniref:flavin reductase family protein n=1 Tax=Henriciella litoralis TaxID=568102 RepID=UPI00146B95FD|nr:flavin reductase family protein [Henriciella litoralis]